MEGNSLLKSCYSMMYRSAVNGGTNWASNVKDILFLYGFGYIWEEHQVGNIESFTKDIDQRIKDCYLQKYNAI